MKNQTYKQKEIDQEEANMRKQKNQVKLTEQKIKELKRRQQLRKEVDFDR